MSKNPNTPIDLNLMKSEIQAQNESAQIGNAIGIASCTIGAAAITLAIVNACRGDYDWSILTSAVGGLNTFIGITNIASARDAYKKVHELNEQYNRLCKHFTR